LVYKQALELRERIPVTPSLSYRYEHFEELTKKSIEEMETIKAKKDNAWSKIDNGVSRKNGNTIIWGAADLAGLLSKMEGEDSMWTRTEMTQIDEDIGRARQIVREIFPGWMQTQNLRSDKPEDVGDFKHHYGFKVRKNLERLNLMEEAEKLTNWVNEQVQNAQTQAEAARLIQEVDSWLTENSEVFRILRVAQIRSLLVPGQEFERRLKKSSTKVTLGEMDEIRTRIASFIRELKQKESELSNKANALWESKIENHHDISPLLKDVKELMLTYEGCKNDLEDLELMEVALKIFQNAYLKLNDFSMTWEEFDTLAKELKSNADVRYGDNDPPPWDLQETLDILIKEVSVTRKTEGQKWIERFSDNEKNISKMTVSEADSLMRKLKIPPAVLTNELSIMAKRISQKAKERCQELEIDWLVEKYAGLPNESKTIFLKKIQIQK
jgi:hypothetical protein